MKRSWIKRSSPTKRRRRALVKRVSTAYKEMQWAKAVRRRDNFQCQFPKCFFISRSIDAHHIAMRSRRPDLKFHTENGIALCRELHQYIHAHQAEGVALGLLSEESYERAHKAA